MHKVIFRSHDFETDRMMVFAPSVGTAITFDGRGFIVETVTIQLTDEYWETPTITVWMV